MKSLVVYSSKYGTTKYCAEKIASFLENVDVRSVDDHSTIDLTSYDRCFIGSSIYMGKLRNNMTLFFKHQKDQLQNKEVHLFVCCNDTTDYKKIFPENIVSHAASLTHFGFELKTSKMKFFDRFVTKKVSGSSEDVFKIKEDVLKSYTMKLSK